MKTKGKKGKKYHVTVGTTVFNISSTFVLSPITEIENQTGHTFHELIQKFKIRVTKIRVTKDWYTYTEDGWREIILEFQFGECIRLSSLVSFIITLCV